MLPSIFYSAAATQARENIQTISVQPLDAVNNHFDTLVRFSNVINTNGGFRNLLLRRDEPNIEASLRKEMSKMYFFGDGLIETGMIVFKDNSTLTTDKTTQTDLDQIGSAWFLDYRTRDSGDTYHLEYHDGDSSPTLYYASKFSNFEDGSAVIVFRCTFLPFEAVLDAMSSAVSSLIIVDNSLSPIYPAERQQNWSRTVAVALETDGIYNETSESISMTYQTRHSDWRIILELTRDKLLSPYQGVIRMVMSAILLFFVILQAAIVVMLLHILRPVHHLSQSMQLLAEGDLTVRSDIRSGDEIEMLGNSFNLMADKLSVNMQKLVEKEKIEQQMKYSLLISQIDPHFIYNTMNSITYLARHGRNGDVINVNRNLMDMLKDRLRISADEFCDSLDREIEILKSYMIIQRYRYGDYFEVKWDIPDDLVNIQVPKNIIQPLMENALYHGLLANKDEDGALIGGLIIVAVNRVGAHIRISVSDNGKGMEAWKAEAFNKGHDAFGQLRGEHIGLKNIRERMKYLYKTDYAMEITSAPGEGTTVTVIYREGGC